MRRKTKWALALIPIIIVPALIFGFYWGWKYFVLPEWPDRKEYKTIEQRAESALAFARRHNMNEHYALFVDYAIPSGTPRLFVWDFEKHKIIASSYAMHGPGKGSTDKHPVFSNEPGSECSALGRFLVTKEHGATLRRSFRLKGMDMDNQTAYARGLMIHSSGWVNNHCWMRYIPPASFKLSGMRDCLVKRDEISLAISKQRRKTTVVVVILRGIKQINEEKRTSYPEDML